MVHQGLDAPGAHLPPPFGFRVQELAGDRHQGNTGGRSGGGDRHRPRDLDVQKIALARKHRQAHVLGRKPPEEDRAYSLLGIFDVNISTVYGEGDHAFIRLQEEILKHIPDQSIFAWGPPMLRDSGALKRSVNSAGKLRLRALLAVTPDMFQHSAEVKPIAPEMLERRLGTRVPPAHFTLTSYGMHSRLPLLKAPGFSYAERRPVWLAVLAYVDGAGHLVALILQPQSRETRDRFFVGASVYVAQQLSTGSLYCDDYRLAALDTPRRVLSWGFAAKLREIYIPHRLDTSNFQFPDPLDDRPMILEQPKRRRRDIIAAPCEVAIPAWVIRNLEREHWVKVTMPEPQTTSLRFETGDHRPKEIRLISESSETIVIKVWTCPNDGMLSTRMRSRL